LNLAKCEQTCLSKQLTAISGEYASLKAIHDAVPSLCPQAFAWGHFSSSPATSFLVTEFLDLSTRSSSSTKGNKTPSLAEKLAKLHTIPAPTPEGYSKLQFGFPTTTCCGDTPQDNSYKESWADFYANNRLRFILRRSELSNGKDKELAKLVEATASAVVPRLLDGDHLNNGKGIVPVVVHGDLWSGNASYGIVGGEGDLQDVVYDPSACYAHNEYELGIMKMFGGFGGTFLKEYHALCPRTEPTGEYDDRVALYELYHHLNHHVRIGIWYNCQCSPQLTTLGTVRWWLQIRCS
jgi:protein-ribulosamine 3-kinase